ncbi:MAG: hypothetical protein IT437_08280 [Phycisphaerales bacterium]|nr:hypothetical protein [Phycisphaerales bacterium]
MKTIWTILSVLAVANLLALLALVGWLKTSGRLDMDRMREIRHVFSTTLADDVARQERDTAAAKTAEAKAKEDAKVGTAPIPAAGLLESQRGQAMLDTQREQRLQREIGDLRRTLQAERQQLDKDKADFAALRAGWEKDRAEILASARDEQFQKTLGTYEQLKPDKAKVALKQLLESGEESRVIAYLDGMADRTRTKIIDEFIKDDPKLAADLLERLRARGVEPRGTEGSP